MDFIVCAPQGKCALSTSVSLDFLRGFFLSFPPLLQVPDKVRSPGFSFIPPWPVLALKLEQLAVGVTSWISFYLLCHHGSQRFFDSFYVNYWISLG